MRDHRDMWGYAISSPLSLSEMYVRLRENGPWTWNEWWKDRLGIYLWAAPLEPPDLGTIWIISNRHGYGVSAKLASDAPDWKARFERVRTRMLDELLPALGAVIRHPSDDHYG